jgi:hypothetical protein
VCVCVFSLHRESPDMILGDKPLISEVVLSHHVSRTSGYATRYGQLRSSRMSRGSSFRLLAQGSSRAATCPVAQALASWLRAAPELPRVPWLKLPPPGSGQLRSRRVSRDTSSHLLSQGSFRVTMCPMELYGLWAIGVNKYPPVAWAQRCSRVRLPKQLSFGFLSGDGKLELVVC